MDAQYLKSEKSRLKRGGRIAVILLLVLVISGSLFAIVSPFFGWRTGIVLSGSMEPAIHTGSVVIVRPIVSENIKKGDVIMYSSHDKSVLITHRVANVENEPVLQFTTKGDANNNSDVNPVAPGQIVGIVVSSIPYLGLFTQFFKTPLGFTLFFLIPAVIIMGSEMLDILSEVE